MYKQTLKREAELHNWRQRQHLASMQQAVHYHTVSLTGWKWNQTELPLYWGHVSLGHRTSSCHIKMKTFTAGLQTPWWLAWGEDGFWTWRFLIRVNCFTLLYSCTETIYIWHLLCYFAGCVPRSLTFNSTANNKPYLDRTIIAVARKEKKTFDLIWNQILEVGCSNPHTDSSKLCRCIWTFTLFCLTAVDSSDAKWICGSIPCDGFVCVVTGLKGW